MINRTTDLRWTIFIFYLWLSFIYPNTLFKVIRYYFAEHLLGDYRTNVDFNLPEDE